MFSITDPFQFGHTNTSDAWSMGYTKRLFSAAQFSCMYLYTQPHTPLSQFLWDNHHQCCYPITQMCFHILPTWFTPTKKKEATTELYLLATAHCFLLISNHAPFISESLQSLFSRRATFRVHTYLVWGSLLHTSRTQPFKSALTILAFPKLTEHTWAPNWVSITSSPIGLSMCSISTLS